MTYSNSLALGRQRFAARNQNTTSFRGQEKTLGPVSNTIMLIVLACLLGLLYLTQVTKTNALGFKVDELEQKRTTLLAEHNQLQVDSARRQSLELVRNSDAAKKLVSVSPKGTVQN